jgi:hypothetical protein
MSEVVSRLWFAARGRLPLIVAAALVAFACAMPRPVWAGPASADPPVPGDTRGGASTLGGTPGSRLPDTGITTCYCDGEGGSCSQTLWGGNSCPGPGQRYYGQDANYRGRQPSYQSNGDETITDQVTGLMWQQADGGSHSWDDAATYCQGLELGGHADWRLPSRKELLSIVDYGKTNPAIDPVFSCSISVYWSDTPRAVYPGFAWYVSFENGSSNYTFMDYANPVRCVRGGQ